MAGGSESDPFEESLEIVRALLAGHEAAAGPDDDELYEANEAVNEALSLRPEDPDAWLLKSQVLSSLGDDFAALAAVEVSLRARPGGAEAHCVRAGILFDIGRLREAQQAIEQAFRHIRGEQDRWLLEELYYEKAVIHDSLGEHATALAAFEEGLRRCPDSELLRQGVAPIRREKLRRSLRVLPGGKKS